jgi:integrase
MADDVREALSAGFRNEKHKAQWKSTLETYAALLRAKPVDTIATDDVLAVLKPIWTTKAETASRVRGRVEKVLEAAKAKGFRERENPARWRGHLDHLLPRPSKLVRGHHAAMPYEDVAAFVAKLRKREATSALALELCILTAARSGEILGMRWPEIDFDKKIWTVPAARMKAGREHRAPLSPRALVILRQLEKLKTGNFVFPGQARNKPLSNMAMEMVLRRMKVEDATIHGFRSSFRDWAGNVSNFPREVTETALAHVIGDKAEQA